MLITYIVLFLLSAVPFIEAIVVVPVAIVGGLPAIPVMIVGFLGNLLTIFLLILFIDKFKRWRQKKKSEETESKRQKRAKSLWDKYGLPGLVFIGPFFVGTHLSAFLALTFGGSRKRTFTLMTVSLFGWTVLLGLAAHYGFDYFLADENNLGFITKLINRN